MGSFVETSKPKRAGLVWDAKEPSPILYGDSGNDLALGQCVVRAPDSSARYATGASTRRDCVYAVVDGRRENGEMGERRSAA